MVHDVQMKSLLQINLHWWHKGKSGSKCNSRQYIN